MLSIKQDTNHTTLTIGSSDAKCYIVLQVPIAGRIEFHSINSIVFAVLFFFPCYII